MHKPMRLIFLDPPRLRPLVGQACTRAAETSASVGPSLDGSNDDGARARMRHAGGLACERGTSMLLFALILEPMRYRGIEHDLPSIEFAMISLETACAVWWTRGKHFV